MHTAGARCENYTLGSIHGHGAALNCEQWSPPVGPPLARVVWLHGYGDHVGRYAHVFATLTAARVEVHAFDQLGHGHSAPHPALGMHNCSRAGDLMDEALAFVDAVEAKQRVRDHNPMFLVGCSLGGMVALYVALRDQRKWAGLVLFSPLVDENWSATLRLQATAARLVARVAPGAPLAPVRPHELSRDEEHVARHVADPLVPHGPVPVAFANAMLRGMAPLRKQYASLTLPVLALHGTADAITRLTPVKTLLAKCASRDVSLRLFEGARHELLHELEAARATEILVDWIVQRAEGAARD